MIVTETLIRYRGQARGSPPPYAKYRATIRTGVVWAKRAVDLFLDGVPVTQGRRESPKTSDITEKWSGRVVGRRAVRRPTESHGDAYRSRPVLPKRPAGGRRWSVREAIVGPSGTQIAAGIERN
jgi:hypothetical protein